MIQFRFIILSCALIITMNMTSVAQTRDVLFDTADVTVVKLKCNSPASEYSPAFCGGGIIFSSDRAHGFGVLSSDSITPDNLYFLRSPESSPDFIGKLNSILQEGAASYSEYDSTLYFTATCGAGGNQLGIFKSVRTPNGSWSKPEATLLPTDSASFFQPCVLDNGNTLIFSSDKNAGFGGTDLYRVVKLDGIWSSPQNLGDEINTPGNEGYASFASGILFFASTGHHSTGGYDNYWCTYKNAVPGNIYSIGDKINSVADDFGIIYDPNSRIGYFTSNRDRQTGDDLYQFSVAWPQFTNCVAHVAPRYCYTFSEENSMQSTDADMFYYQWSFGDGTVANSLEADHCFGGPGVYTVELVIRDRKDTSFFMSQVVYDHEIAEKPGLRINCPDTVFVGDSVEITSNHSLIEGYHINNYYWDFGDHYMIKRKDIMYVPADAGSFNLQLGVVAEADRQSNDSVEMTEQYFCTEKRLIVLDSSEKLAWLDKQSARSLSATVKADGVPLFDLSQIQNPEYSVFLGSSTDSIAIPQPGTDAIVRIVKEGDVYRYLYGSAENMRAIHTTYVELKELGIDSAFVIVLSDDTIVAHQINPKRDFIFTDVISKLIADTVPEAAVIPVNVVEAVGDTMFVYFNNNESILNTANMKLLDSLLAISAGAKYHLMAFSDQRGNDEYNLRLSKTRSAAVKSYLLSKGVPQNTVSQKAYGEERPREHQKIISRMLHERCVIIITTPAPHQ